MTPLALVLVQKRPAAAAELSLGSPMLGLRGYQLAWAFGSVSQKYRSYFAALLDPTSVDFPSLTT